MLINSKSWKSCQNNAFTTDVSGMFRVKKKQNYKQNKIISIIYRISWFYPNNIVQIDAKTSSVKIKSTKRESIFKHALKFNIKHPCRAYWSRDQQTSQTECGRRRITKIKIKIWSHWKSWGKIVGDRHVRRHQFERNCSALKITK